MHSFAVAFILLFNTPQHIEIDEDPPFLLSSYRIKIITLESGLKQIKKEFYLIPNPKYRYLCPGYRLRKNEYCF
jgi:hypothetical protein